jgi:hypothetical protein
MEPRAPDLYQMDQLVDSEYPETDERDSEMEQARLASLEDSWAFNKTARDKWDRFQPMLEHVKRVGAFDKTIQQVYDLLSILLYQYAYGIDAFVPLDTLDLIEHRIKTIRLPDKDLLQGVMDHLRSSL